LKNATDLNNKHWENLFGDWVLQYFNSFVSSIQQEKFATDELLREGLEESVPKGVLKLRIVDKTSDYNEIVLDDGAVVIQTTTSRWGANMNYAARKLVNIL